jgi:hypothetical protein
MKRVLVALGTMAVVGASGTLLACSGLLGIGVASQEAEDSGAAMEAEAGVPVGVTCAYYCSLMDKNCNWTKPFGEYENLQTCIDMCNNSHFDPGNGIAASNDDTLGCRVFYAQQAGTDPAKNCAFAGLLGGGQCGTSACDDFCTADLAYCNSKAISSFPYHSQSECANDCLPHDGGALDAGDGGNTGYGYPYVKEDAGELFNIESGNTLNCRMWHLNAAYQSGGGVFHCPHTALVSTRCK